MKRPTVLFDVGGVCLTNGWDTGARQAAAAHFGLDFGELETRHDPIVDAFERGERTLHAYLDVVVFHRPRPFSRGDFIAFMESRSQPHEDVLTLLRGMAAAGSYPMATINNESRELNQYRIGRFRLHGMFRAFFSSCYVGVRKPDAGIYQFALDVMHADPAASLFVDDREENIEGARALGMRTIHVVDRRNLAAQLRQAGVT